MKTICDKEKPMHPVLKPMMLGFFACVLGACGTLQNYGREIQRPKPLESPSTEDKAMVYNEIAIAQREKNQAFVQINAGDIELPLTAGPSAPSDNRTYSIEVWFDDSVIPSGGIEAAMKNGDIVVDVLGARAKITPASYGAGSVASDPGITRKLLIEVDSRDLTQAFTVVAKSVRHSGKWQEAQDELIKRLRQEFLNASEKCTKECRGKLREHRNETADDGSRALANLGSSASGDGEQANSPAMLAYEYLLAGERFEKAQSRQNPYMAVKTVRVFNGDLHTQIYMLSDEEARDAFGSNFSKYFYVGKAYFRNRHADKKLIVHTTSLRARTVFYREPVDGNGEGKSFWQRMLPARGTHGNENSYDRYGYISESPEDPGKSTGVLTVSDEDLIVGVVRSEWVISEIIKNKDKEDDSSILNLVILDIKAKLDLGVLQNQANQAKERNAKKFASQALTAVSRSVRSCQLPSQVQRNSVNDAKEYARAIYLSIFEEDESKWREAFYGNKQKNNDTATKQFRECLDLAVNTSVLRRARDLSPSPATVDVRKRVGLMDKIASASRDTYWQQRLASHGYMWHDYYRPMTFEAVLISLSAKTKAHPNNRIIEYLQSIGVIAGSLVGLNEISSRFGTEDFAQRAAFTTGVFVPEIRKLLMRDLDQYLANLASTALPSIITLGPNESRDGYVFFPRGPIYGYGVDEFSLNQPSYIVNIDNEDVAVDGALVESELAFASGQKALDMVQSARNQGRSRVDEDLRKLADLQAKVFSYRLQFISNNVCDMIAANNFSGATAYLNNIKKEAGAGENKELLTELTTRAAQHIPCDKPLSGGKPDESANNGSQSSKATRQGGKR